MVRNSSGTSDIQAYLVVEPVRDLLASMMSGKSPTPVIVLFQQVPKNLLTAEVGMPFWGPGRMSLTMLARDESAAKEVEETARKLVALFREVAAKSVEEFRTNPLDENLRKLLGDAALGKALDDSAGKMRNELFAEYLPKRNKEWLTISADLDEGLSKLILSKANKQSSSKPAATK
jgi:hypothetical protein